MAEARAGDPLPTSRRISQGDYPEGSIILDGLLLEPLAPYQTVSQYGFLYTLVPVDREEAVKKDVRHMGTQTAVPLCTLGTQTEFVASSTTVQTELSLPPQTSLALAEGVPGDMRGSETASQSTYQYFDTGVQRASTPESGTAPDVVPELDTTFGSTSIPDPHDATLHTPDMVESSDDEDDELSSPPGSHHSRPYIHQLDEGESQ
ncbi:uncharacterized protein LOC135375568 [Ornithodoros turicata]|uniref:uncharacterized protein LOC135375568 n=1 Tax=Ornithodoros turicata TaxID=34597 RepID=UPI003138F8F3